MPALGLPLALPYLNYTYARGGAATAPADDDFGSVEALVPMRSIQTNGGGHTFDFVYGNRWEANGVLITEIAGGPFGEDAVGFGGSGSYWLMDVSDYGAIVQPRFDPTDDFTLEAWVYLDSTGAQAFFHRSQSLTDGVYLEANASTEVELTLGTSGGYETFTGTTTLSVGTWYHIAAVKDGSNVHIFVDGNLESTTAISNAVGFNDNADVYIGRNPDETGRDFDGRMSWLRWTQGIARYTASFTAPTEGFVTQTEVGTDANWANVILLIQPDDEAEGSTTITDESGTATAITAFNNTKITRADPLLFGLGSNIYNDDVGDNSRFHVELPNPQDTLNGDFTVEMWTYFEGPGSTDYKFTTEEVAADPGSFRTGTFHVRTPNNTLLSETTTNSAAEGHRWNYEAIVRSGSTVSYYWNGQLEASATDSSTWTIDDIYFGWLQRASNSAFDGRFGPIRITKGVARDVTVVPTAPFPTSGP